MSAIDRLVATDEIRRLAYRYADALDRRDIESLVSLYRPDARFGAHGDGPDACRTFFRESLSEIGMAVLLVANHLIEFVDADNATGTVWTHGFIDDGAPGGGEGEGFIQQLIKYDDRYVRVDSEWRFTRRRHFLWLGWRNGEGDPLGQPPADWPASQVGLGSIPYGDPTWVEFWADAASG